MRQGMMQERALTSGILAIPRTFDDHAPALAAISAATPTIRATLLQSSAVLYLIASPRPDGMNTT